MSGSKVSAKDGAVLTPVLHLLESRQNLALVLHMVWWVFLKSIIVMHCKLVSVHYSLTVILHSLRKGCVWLFYSFIIIN